MTLYHYAFIHKYGWQDILIPIFDLLIDYQSMKIFLIIILVIAYVNTELCQDPQKTFYMSFPTMSKRDEISKLFRQMDETMTSYNSTYTDSGLQATFKIINLRPQAYYNDHHQEDSYIDFLNANVSMGILSISSNFNFSVSYGTQNKSGNIRIRGFLDPSYFTKKLNQVAGYLEWKLGEAPALTFSQLFHIQYYNPALTEDQINIFTKMVNGQAGPVRIKDDIINQVNSKYVPLLIDHLNHQDLFSANNITYKYKNITLNILNYAQNFTLSNDNTKGLEVFLAFGLQSSKQICTKLPKTFDQDQYGGLQQLYTFNVVKSFFKQALNQGLFDITLDRSWEVPGFQFYMGDLGNFVPYANFAPANDTFAISCKYNQTRGQTSLKMVYYSDYELYVSVPIDCTANYNNTDILSASFDVNFYVRLTGEEESVRVVVADVGIFGDTYKSLNPKYQIGSQTHAKYSITEILKGLRNKTVFGNDFPLIRRKYPVIRIREDLIIVYDPSEA